MKVREGGRVINAVEPVATGVNADGRREVLGLRVATSKTGAAWNSFVADLVARGLAGHRPRHQRHAPRAGRGYCREPAQSGLATTPHALRGEYDVDDTEEHVVAGKAMLHSVYNQPDAEAVSARFDRLLEYVGGKLPDASEHLDPSRSDILAGTGFPEGLWQ